MGIAGTQRRIARNARRLGVELGDAAANARESSWERQLGAWLHGFEAKQLRIFDFDEFGYGAYLSEVQRRANVARLNSYRHLLGDKLLAFLYLREMGAPTPAVYAFGQDRDVVVLDGRGAHEGLDGLLRAHGKLVVKPRHGSGGSGFRVLEHVDGTTLSGGRPVAGVRDELRGAFIVSEFVEQHEYARRIHPESTNTIRIISLRDPDSGAAFVAAAVHRFGTRASGPVDNTGAGGVTAGIDVATGTLGPVAAMPGYAAPRSGPVVWSDEHPDSGVRITGTAIPHWAQMIASLNRTMATLAGFHYVGWDVLVTPDGFSILEGNTRPDVILQVHGPLLTDPRTRRFFEAHPLFPPAARLSGLARGRRFARGTARRRG